MTRLSAFCSAILVLVPITGCCLLEPPGDSNDVGQITLSVEAPTTASKGETAALKARIEEDVDAANLAYRWFQTYGRLVEILNADGPQASFVAPSLPSEQTLRFRVDVSTPDGTVYGAAVEVTVAADPDYGLDESIEEESEEENPYPRVRLVTSMGEIVLELDRINAPLTVNNFLRYVNDGFYDGTIFHRVIAEFVIQGGGFEPGLERKETRSPIRNESDNGLKNDRGTVAMARTNDLHSATSQFYINLIDNDSLNASSGADGYTVFGQVVQGMDVVDEIGNVETESQQSPTGDKMNDVPIEDVVLRRAERSD